MEKKPVALLLGNREDLIEKLAEEFEVVSSSFVPGIGKHPALPRRDIAVVVTTGSIGVPDELLADLPDLRYICLVGAGYERINLDGLAARGVVVTNCAGINALAVAEVAVGHLIALLRRLREADAFVRSGAWDAIPDPRWWAPGLQGRKVGIYGLGHVGSAVAAGIQAFGSRVGYCSRSRKPDREHRWFPDLLSLARWADDLVVCTSLDAGTRHSVDRHILQALGPTGFIVNIARGAVIDEGDLIAALQTGTIAGAGLDVFEGEPSVNPALLAQPNVLLSPHVGGMTIASSAVADDFVMSNVRAYFAGRPLASLLTDQVPDGCCQTKCIER